jgi:hypothetical protein
LHFDPDLFCYQTCFTPSYVRRLKKFQAIEGFIASQPPQDYAPLPSDSKFWGGGTANSNTS